MTPAQVPWDAESSARAYATVVCLATQYWPAVRHHLRLRLISQALRSATPAGKQKAQDAVRAARCAVLQALLVPATVPCMLLSGSCMVSTHGDIVLLVLYVQTHAAAVACSALLQPHSRCQVGLQVRAIIPGGSLLICPAPDCRVTLLRTTT